MYLYGMMLSTECTTVNVSPDDLARHTKREDSKVKGWSTASV